MIHTRDIALIIYNYGALFIDTEGNGLVCDCIDTEVLEERLKNIFSELTLYVFPYKTNFII